LQFRGSPGSGLFDGLSEAADPSAERFEMLAQAAGKDGWVDIRLFGPSISLTENQFNNLAINADGRLRAGQKPKPGLETDVAETLGEEPADDGFLGCGGRVP
jgi:hypothetical protein